MSSVLDLAGATHTILVDTTETYWKITNSVTGGELVLEPGAVLEFEDREGCGFDSSALSYSIVANGNAGAKCYIKSNVEYPNHRWILPASTSVTMTRTVLLNYAGSIPNTWVMNNCETYNQPLTYYAKTAIRNLTGTELADEVLDEVFGTANLEVMAELAANGIAMPDAENIILKGVLLNKSIAGVLTRYRLDGTRVGSVNVDGIATGDSIADAVKYYELKARELLIGYIRENLPSSRSRLFVKRLNI